MVAGTGVLVPTTFQAWNGHRPVTLLNVPLLSSVKGSSLKTISRELASAKSMAGHDMRLFNSYTVATVGLQKTCFACCFGRR